MVIGNLSEDLQMEILCRLPVKSLLQLKSVCKYWYALIQNPNFVSLHHHRAASTAAAKNTDCLLVKRFLNGSVTLSLVPNEAPVEDIDISSIVLCNLSVKEPVRVLQMLGSCNGVVCLTGYGGSSPIVLCNPSVKEFRLLPKPSYKKDHMCILGFGFDPYTADYKVVRFAMKSLPITDVDERVEVYDLSTDSWREIDTRSPVVSGFICSCASYASWDVYFSWYANPKHGGAPMITSFSMSHEVFEEWPVPEICLLDQRSEKELLPLNNSLAMAIYSNFLSQLSLENSFDIWVMNKEDIEVSWTKKFTIGILQGLYWALGFRQNGEFLLVCIYGKMMSYNLNTQETKEYQVHDQVGGFGMQALLYTESLVSVKRHN